MSNNMHSRQYFYAVRVGRTPGIYNEWKDCQNQVVGYSGARYKKFSTHDQAAAFIHNATPPPSPPRHSSTPSLNTMMNYFNAPQIMVPRTTSAASTIIDLVDDEKEDKEIRHHHHHSLTSNLLPKPMLSVAELIEQKRQQAIARKQMKAKERAAVASGPAQPGISLKRRYSDELPSGQVQKRAKATASEPEFHNPPHDGACAGNGREGAVAGIGVFFGDDDLRNVSERLEGDRQTNQRAELMAAIRCLEVVMQHHTTQVDLEVRTDSIYVVKGITEWIVNWKKKNWTMQIVNKDLWQRLDDLHHMIRQVDWVHVAGHAGIKGNEEADKLAVAGAMLPAVTPNTQQKEMWRL